jgi:probable HAF family extracellular repeat protein
MRSVFQSILRGLLPTALALAAGGALAAPTYKVKVIAPPEQSGGVDMHWYNAIDLNNDGKSLAHMHQYANPYSSFMTVDKLGNKLWLPDAETPPSRAESFVALNNWGDVIGSRTHSNWIWMGTVLKAEGYGAEIHGLPDDIYGGYFSDAYAYAYDANDLGQVVGTATSSTDGRWRAYTWKDDVMVEIGTFGGASSTAVGVNRGGVVIGTADLADGSHHAFAYRNGRLHDLGTLGGTNSSARSINNKGQIVGTAQQADGAERAFLFSDRVMTALPTPEGASASAWSINRDGFVLGSYRLDGTSHLFVYDGVAVHRLDDLVNQPPHRPWQIESAAAINDKGWIVCDARRDGDQHATVVILKPLP